MTTCTMLRVLNGLSSDNDEARDALRSFAAGDRVSVDVNRRREHKSLRRWWAACTIIADNCEGYGDKECVSGYLQLRAGHCDVIANKRTGESYLIPRGINYRRVPDEAEMQNIWSRAVKVICEEIMPRITEPELENELLQMIGAAVYR